MQRSNERTPSCFQMAGTANVSTGIVPDGISAGHCATLSDPMELAEALLTH